MDVIKEMEVSLYCDGKSSKKMRLYFDSGSPYTFIKKSSAEAIGGIFKLPSEERFVGLGGGGFISAEAQHLHIKVLNVWCAHFVYVIDDAIFKDEYDMLVGHDFMQKYGIKVVPHTGDIEIDEVRLKLSQTVRMV